MKRTQVYTKWKAFYRHIKIHFLNRKSCVLIKISLQFVLRVQMIHQHWLGTCFMMAYCQMDPLERISRNFTQNKMIFIWETADVMLCAKCQPFCLGINLLTVFQVWWDMCPQLFNTLRSRQNGRHFADDIFKLFFFLQKLWLILIKDSLNFVHRVQLTWYIIGSDNGLVLYRRQGIIWSSDDIVHRHIYMCHSASMS